MDRVEQAWAGIDAGKGHDHVVVIDDDGRRLLSRRVANGEADLSEILAAALGCPDEVTWAIDLADGPAALVIALLLEQRLLYLPGVAVNRISGALRGEGRTDAKDAAIIADRARMRRDLRELRLEEESIAELRMLTAHRADAAEDRTRSINRLRVRLLGIFPALERVLDFTNKGPLVLISGFQTVAAINDIGQEGLTRWLRGRKVRDADKLAAAATQAAASQRVRIRGEATAAALIARLATSVLDLDRQLAELDKLIAERFRADRNADIIASMVGIGDPLGAEFLAATSGSLSASASADHLAGHAGLAPHHATRALAPATCTDPGATTANCSASSTPPQSPPSNAVQRPRPSTTANAPKASATTKPSSHSHGGASTSSGRCFETNGLHRTSRKSAPRRMTRGLGESGVADTAPDHGGFEESCRVRFNNTVRWGVRGAPKG